jgi:hypothetical protein
MSHIKRFLRWFFYDFPAYYSLPVLIGLVFLLVFTLRLAFQ